MKLEATDRRFKKHETAAFMAIYNSLSNPFMTKLIAEATYEEAEKKYVAQFGRRRFGNYMTFLTSRARYLKRNKREKQVT